MVKKKSSAVIMAADATGGLSQLADHRFVSADWPVQWEIDPSNAEHWLAYLSADAQKRGWQYQSFGQLEHNQNSGSLTIRDAQGAERVAIAWERNRGRTLRIFAKPFSDEERRFLDEVTEHCRARVTEQFHCRGQLTYNGLPWHGELWLTASLRLAAPSRHDDRALLGPRVVVVDALLNAIDGMNANAIFAVLVREVSVFLSVVLRTRVGLPESGRAWSIDRAPDGAVTCEPRDLGYIEQHNPAGMPERGEQRAVPTRPVSRPDLSLVGIMASDTEQWVPDDTIALWEAFQQLAPNKRRDFLQAGSLYQLAFDVVANFRTAAFAFGVAACEALKPAGREFERHNAYDVIEVLLGKSIADDLRAHRVRPQDVRSVLFHRGEFRADEFIPRSFVSSFQDPTFDQATRVIFRVAHAAIIEWLRLGGTLVFPPRQSTGNWRRSTKKHALILLPIAFVLGMAFAFGLMHW